MSHSFFSATLLEVIQESPKVKRLVLGFAEELDFIPGQFITLKFPQLQDENGFELERSYSIARFEKILNNAYACTVEICFSLKLEGLVTPILWQLSLGDKILSTAPQGEFVLRESRDLKSVNFICTGTGLVPFLPMIDSLLSQGFQGDIHLVIGNRYYGDVIYQGLMKEWESNNQVQLFYAFSREENDKYFGYVHRIYQEFDLANSNVYVCGWKEMCAETRKNLKAMGLTRKQYFFEQYD